MSTQGWVRGSFSKRNTQRINAALLLIEKAVAEGKAITRLQMFEAMVDMGHYAETSRDRRLFSALILEAKNFGHKQFEAIKDVERRPYTPEENEIILTMPRAEAARLTGRPPKHISAQKYILQNTRRPEAGKSKGTPFTQVEMDLLREKYSTVGAKKLLPLFPGRTMGALIAKAKYMGLRRAPTLVPSLDGHKHVIADIIQIANARGITAVQLDALCNTAGYFKWNWRNSHRRLNLLAIERACRLLGLDFGVRPSAAERPPLRHMIREFKAFHCPLIDEVKPKVGKGLASKRATPPRPLVVGNHRPTDEVLELARSIVPRNHPAREDAIQDICAELIAGGLTKDDFNTKQGMRNIRDIVSAAYRQNFEQSGFARSMDARIGEGTSTLHDLIAAE